MNLKCPHCGNPVSAEVNGGKDCGGVKDILGQRIDHLYFCVCFNCWKKFEIVNGQVADLKLFVYSNLWEKK